MEGDSSEEDNATNFKVLYMAYLRRLFRRRYAFLCIFCFLS